MALIKYITDVQIDFGAAQLLADECAKAGITRPFVVTDKGAALCRPSENVLDLLPDGAVAEFTKEDGEVVKRG